MPVEIRETHILGFAEIAMTNTRGNHIPGSFSKGLQARQRAPALSSMPSGGTAIFSYSPCPMQVGLRPAHWPSGSGTLGGGGRGVDRSPGVNVP